MVKSSVIFLLLLVKISFFGASANAQRESELEPMVVVETRSPVPLSEASPWVTRISGEDLIERQIYNLSDALRSVPGMAIARTGQLGSQTSLFSRGGESNHVTFLYEGRRLNGGFSGTYNLGELSTLGSSSIEILKGSSSLNGANAMGGTVHMRNELPLVDGYESNVGFSAGSFDTLISNYNTRFKKGKWGGNFSFSSLDTENDRPHSKFESLSSSFLIENQLTDGLTVNFLGLGYDNYLGTNFNKYFAVSPNNYQETVHFLISPQVEIKTDAWDASVNYSYSEDEINYTPSWNMLYWTEQENVDFLSNLLLSDRSTLQFGLGYSTSRFLREGNFLNSWEQTYSSLGISHEITKDTELDGNIRFSDYSDFKNAVTYDFKVRRSISENLSVYGKYAIGFAPPEALDLYEFSPTYPGNLNLEAEESQNFEVGFTYEDPSASNIYGITLYFTQYDNLIRADYDFTNWVYFPAENIDKSESYGLEISSKNQISERLYLDSSVSYKKSKDLDSNNDFLPKRPEFFGSVTATYGINSLNVGTQMNFKTNTKENATNENDDYIIARLFGNYEISDDLIFNARIENLFDEKYEEVIGYPALGRAVHAGLTYNF